MSLSARLLSRAAAPAALPAAPPPCSRFLRLRFAVRETFRLRQPPDGVTSGPAFWEQVAKGLVAVLEGPEPWRLSVTKVATSLGISLSTLKKHYSQGYARLIAVRQAHQEHERKQRFALRREALRAAVFECLDVELYPLKQHVFERAGLSRRFDVFLWP